MISGSQVSDSAIKRAYWYLTHKELLRKVLVYVLAMSNLTLWIFVVFYLVRFYYLDRQPFAQALSQLGKSQVNYSTFNKANQPIAISSIYLQPIKTTGGKYDLLALFKNDNADWVGRVVGRFMVGNKQYIAKSFTVLPKDNVYAIEAGVEPGDGLFKSQFVIDSVQWKRIGNKDVFNRFVREHAGFVLNDIKYRSASQLNLGKQVAVSDVSFEIANNSLYDYWTVDNNVLFMQGSSIVSASVIPLEEFMIGQRRQINFRVFENLGNITKVEVKPFLDVFDTTNFIEDPLVVGEIK